MLLRKRAMPRNRVLKDDALRELAVQALRHKTALAKLRAVPKGLKTPICHELKAVPRGRNRQRNSARTERPGNKLELGHWLTF